MAEVDEWRGLLAPLLGEAGLCAIIKNVEPMNGGVSSDIVRVELADGKTVCAKKALCRLRVENVWEAPPERNHFEVSWLRFARQVDQSCAPNVLGEDQAHGIALLEYLDPRDYRLWKTQLLTGDLQETSVRNVAAMLAQIHLASWASDAVARDFATDEYFYALRLEPYLATLAERLPSLRENILTVLEKTRNTKLALVHGDVSPKNILIANDDGHAVFLDAECAWYGDPAFDAAFCINHLLLKAVHLLPIRERLLDAALMFIETWCSALPEQARADADLRVAHLLPCLLAARIDGKSPVEYLTRDERDLVRRISHPHIAEPPKSVASLVASLRQTLSSRNEK